MTKFVSLLGILLATSMAVWGSEPEQQERVMQVAQTEGLIAFWDFKLMHEGKWSSYHDENVVQHGYPAVLRRIGDPKSYSPEKWPYEDGASKLKFDSSGPFGHAARFNQGYVFAEVPRDAFDLTPLDIRRRQPFTMIGWVKFVGKRHLVAGIWDEGGWDKYGGRRQVALFGGLFGSQGVIGHISTTGASSYPQSTISGSQYARCRAIDGRGFENGQWVSVAMTFDPASGVATAYCDGVATPTLITDPVANDVFQYEQPVASNPSDFPWPIYSPRAFVLKFNGYNVRSTGVYEHWLHVDAEKGIVTYDRSCKDTAQIEEDFRVRFDVHRQDKSRLGEQSVFEATAKKTIALDVKLQSGDEIITSLEVRQDDGWQRVGTEIHYQLRDGAPFTFGRALGLGNEPIEHGTQIHIDGVAVFARVLSQDELKQLSFADR